MKGKELTAKEVEKLEENTKIVLEFGNEKILSQVKREPFYMIGSDSEIHPNSTSLRFIKKSKDGCTWSSGLKVGKYYEWKEDVKMKSYKTWEVIKMLDENPKLKFRCLTDCGLHKNISVINNTVCWAKDLPLYVAVDSEIKWSLVQQPVSFMEAVQAFKEGKTITEMYSPFHSIYGKNEARMMEISAEEILTGNWFMEECEDER
jgi:hypothetical protein